MATNEAFATDAAPRGRVWDRLTLHQKQVVWAWAFLAVPVLFYVVIRFWPTLDAFWISFTNWNLLQTPDFVGSLEQVNPFDTAQGEQTGSLRISRILPGFVRYAGRVHEQPQHRLPVRSTVCPTSRPGIFRTNSFRQARMPRYGPPYMNGVPRLCPSATAMSAP